MRGNAVRNAYGTSLKHREYLDYLALLAALGWLAACGASDANNPATVPNAGTGAGTSAGSAPNAGSGNALAGGPSAGQLASGGTGAAGSTAAAGGSGAGVAGRFGTAGRNGTAGRGSVAGTGGSAGSSGAAGNPGPTSPVECPAPPAGTAAAAITALNAVNQLRVPAGAGCATFSQAIADGATKHCEYYAANSSNQMCIADPHSEVMSCTGFTGKGFADRVKAAGYTGSPAFEVMAFVNNPQSAVSTWVNSVWHRIPIMSPWVTELGYGAAARCDTIDFGRGKPLPDATLVVYPYDGQTGVPTSFDGSREGPTPPIPATGKWPSGPPISFYAKKATFTDHVLTKDGDSTPISHVWLAPASVDAQFKGFLTDVVFMYPDSPLTAATKYRVHMKGTAVGGAIDREWTFTTR